MHYMVTVLLENNLDHTFLYLVAFCYITHWFFILFFFHFVRAIYDAYSTFTAIFHSLLQAVCVISGADPGVGKGRGTNRLSVARQLEK